jgi:hypothetical protein
MRFFGYDLELTVETILAAEKGPRLFTASDSRGAGWLVAQVGYEESHLAWLCAPVSERAAHAVAGGGADPRDAFRHSLTGMVELVTIDEGRATPDQCLLCGDLPDDLLVTIPVCADLPIAG